MVWYLLTLTWCWAAFFWAAFAFACHLKVYGRERAVASCLLNFFLWPLGMAFATVKIARSDEQMRTIPCEPNEHGEYLPVRRKPWPLGK